MGRSILKFSAEVVPRCPFGPKTAKKWKTPPPKCVTFDFTLIGGGAGAPPPKTNCYNCYCYCYNCYCYCYCYCYYYYYYYYLNLPFL